MDSMIGIPSDATGNETRREHVSDAVITAVATAKGVDPLDLEPLYSVIDPDALDAMFRQTGDSPSTSLELHFSMAGCQVVVHGDGEVDVNPPAECKESPTTIAPRED